MIVLKNISPRGLMIIAIIMGGFSSSKAQDFHLSQYEASPLIINPATTGMFKGDYRATLHHRSQWASIVSNPFRSSALSFDTKAEVKGVGFNAGGYLHHTSAGSGNFSSTSIILTGAYDYQFDDHPHHHVAGGLQLGGIVKSVNFDGLTFADQYDPADGGSFTNSTSETFNAGTSFLPEVGAGVMYYYTNTNKRINPFLGFSAMHLTQPNESLLNGNQRLPMRFNLHPGVKVHINRKFSFLVDAITMQQGNVNEIMFGWKGYSYFKSKDAYALYGLTRRTNDDAVIAHFGVQYGQFLYRLSYDLNTSALQQISNSRGGFEISITFISSKVDPLPEISCPDL